MENEPMQLAAISAIGGFCLLGAIGLVVSTVSSWRYPRRDGMDIGLDIVTFGAVIFLTVVGVGMIASAQGYR